LVTQPPPHDDGRDHKQQNALVQPPLMQTRKADFSDIYTAPDPRPYYRTLAQWDYQVPEHALPVIERALNACDPYHPLGRASNNHARNGRAAPAVLDLCCSYAPNAALLRHNLTFDDITEHYLSRDLDSLSPAELLTRDRDFYAAHLVNAELRVVGLDASEPAITYARNTGLLTDGWAENLEQDLPSADLARGLRDVQLIVCTGGVGYIGHQTFDRVLQCVQRPHDVWIVLFVLRAFNTAEIVTTLQKFDLVSEHIPAISVRQRRFATQHEAAAAIHDVRLRGLDPAGKEDTGWLYADLHIARPAAAAQAQGTRELLSGLPNTIYS
jgi:hypothetical protein